MTQQQERLSAAVSRARVDVESIHRKLPTMAEVLLERTARRGDDILGSGGGLLRLRYLRHEALDSADAVGFAAHCLVAGVWMPVAIGSITPGSASIARATSPRDGSTIEVDARSYVVTPPRADLLGSAGPIAAGALAQIVAAGDLALDEVAAGLGEAGWLSAAAARYAHSLHGGWDPRPPTRLVRELLLCPTPPTAQQAISVLVKCGVPGTMIADAAGRLSGRERTQSSA